jgi:hypothetical protein
VDDWDQTSLYMQSMRSLLPDGSSISDEELAHFKINSIGGLEITKAGQRAGFGIQFHKAVSDMESNMAVDRKAVITRELERLQAELFEIEQYGEDNYDDNTVLVFDMKFPNTETIFTYAAIKKDSAWFITGVQTGQYKTWAQLVSFWKDRVVSIHKVATFDEVFIRETSQNKGVLEGEVLDKDTDYDKPEYNPQA